MPPLSLEDVVQAVQSIPGLFPRRAQLSAQEIGNGNMNFVFRVQDVSEEPGFSVIVKHTPPYMRSVGAGWPLTAERIRLEHDLLILQHAVAPQRVPTVYHFDAVRRLLVMEDLSDHRILRDALIERHPYADWARQVGTFLASMWWETSALSRSRAAIHQLRAQFANPELVQITSDFVFTYPFMPHAMNRSSPRLHGATQALWGNQALQEAVRTLKAQFHADGDALIHGDLHTGSIMVADGDTKVIDPEFGFYGPMAFDMGVLMANLFLQWCARAATTPGSPDNTTPLRDMGAVWTAFARHVQAWWPNRRPDSDRSTSPAASLTMIWVDALGYAGCEMVRRVIGTSHVADLETIVDSTVKLRAEGLALDLGRWLIVEREHLRTWDEVFARVQAWCP